MATSTTPDRPTMEPIRSEGGAPTGIAPDPTDSHPADTGPPAAASPPLRSVHTSNFSAILQELGISVLVRA